MLKRSFLSDKPINGIFLAILSGAALSVVLGIIRFILGYGTQDRISGTFSSPVRYGNIMGYIVILGVGILLFNLYNTKRERNIFIAATIISFIGLFASTTRGAIIACMTGIIIICIYHKRTKGVIFSVIFILAAVSCILIIPQLKEKVIEAFIKFNDPTTSFGWRFVLWKESIKVFLENPILGVGLSNLSAGYLQHIPVKYQSVAHAHNNFLQILAEHGLVGFVAISLLMIRIFVAHVKAVKQGKYYSFIGMILIIVITIEGISEYGFFNGENSMLFWFIQGAILGKAQNMVNLSSQPLSR
jgi:O-antigen ligase